DAWGGVAVGRRALPAPSRAADRLPTVAAPSDAERHGLPGAARHARHERALSPKTHECPSSRRRAPATRIYRRSAFETTLGAMPPGARRGGEIEGLKARIAEAFVESIFRRAGYRVTRASREIETQRPLRIGADEFLPDFLLHKPAAEAPAGRLRHRLIPIEVKYRASVEEFLRNHGDELLVRLGAQWPALRLVFVTDQPAAGRSCFQVLDLAATPPAAPLASVDL